MKTLDRILRIQIVMALILAAILCFAVWRLAKAGGNVNVGLVVNVDWGKNK